ncbi:MAG: DEAD/DEAH box helicase, partial [Luteibacter jiangsuensis]
MNDFKQLPLLPALLAAIDGLGYPSLTAIQREALPHILEGRDVIAQARTGSGKTAAFALGLLQRIDVSQIRLQALVLCPTRELADQVAKAIRRLAVNIPNVKLLTLCGGMPLGPQLASLEHDPHIVVGTPGRVQEHLKRGSLHGGGIKVFVLDEADRMLDMGFEEAMDDIVKRIAKHHQTLLFSATYPEAIRAVSARMQHDPVEISVEEVHDETSIEQRVVEAEPPVKLDVLSRILAQAKPEAVLVFCNMRKDTESVAAELDRRGFSALALHGDLEQRDRDEVLVRFANRSCTILV